MAALRCVFVLAAIAAGAVGLAVTGVVSLLVAPNVHLTIRYFFAHDVVDAAVSVRGARDLP